MSRQEIPEGTVTVLFTDLVESTQLNQSLGDEASRQIGRQVEEMARAAVTSNRGVLIKEMGDGLMAGFASARRAVAAAKEMQIEMQRLHQGGLDEAVLMRIGLHTGEVIDEDGDLHGETVIIAKRIEGLAPAGGILASETVYGVLGTARDELVERGVTELKGIDNDWNLFEVPVPEPEATTGAVLADTQPTPYIGRTSELDTVRSIVEAAAGGRGGFVMIGAPAGMGKSRLVREAAAIASQLGMAVYTGNCLDMESPPPYQPTIDHLEQAARSNSHDGFRSALGVNAPELAKLLPSLRQRYDDIPPSPELTPEQERRYMLHGVGEFIERAAANQPLMLTFEDLHWADESALLLLRHIGSRTSSVPVFVVGTYRDDELESDRPLTTALGPLLRDAGAVDVRLRPLSKPELGRLIAERAGSDPPPQLVDLVHDETQGNPFFTEELFRHLRDSGRLFDDDGNWRSGFEIGDTEVPQGVKLVIERRLDQLDREHRRIVAAAAVVGRTFTFDTLAAIVKADEDDVFDALEAAERIHVIEELPADHPADHLFVQEQVRQTLVGELSLARRQRVHLRIADAMEEQGVAAPVELAHHLLSAGSAAPVDRTVDAFVAAAERSMDALAFEDALRHLDHAVDRSGSDADALHRLHRLQAKALRGAGRVDDALSVLDEALTLAADNEQRIAIRLFRVGLLNDQYRATEAQADLDALVTAAAESDDPELDIEVQLARGRAYYIMSLDDPSGAQGARDAYEAAYAAAKERNDATSMVRALLPTTWFTDYWYDYRAIARANIEEAVELAEALGDEDLILEAMAATLRTNPRNNTLDACEALLSRLEERRDPVKLNAHCFWMMWQYLRHGRLAGCVAMCDRGIELSDLIGSEPVQYGSIKAIALSEMGRFDLVDAAIDQEVTDDDHPFGQAIASLARSLSLWRMAAWDPAVELLTETLDRADQVNRVWMRRWAGTLLEVARTYSDGSAAPYGDGAGDQWSIGDLTRTQVALASEQWDRCVELVTPLCPDLPPGARHRTEDGRRAEDGRGAEDGRRAGDGRGAEDGRRAEDERGAVDGRRAGDFVPGVDADGARTLDLLAQAELGRGNATAALDAATHGLAIAEPMEFGWMIWRLHRVRALALAALGRVDESERAAERADTEFRAVAERIQDPELCGWFERQPLSPMA